MFSVCDVPLARCPFPLPLPFPLLLPFPETSERRKLSSFSMISSLFGELREHPGSTENLYAPDDAAYVLWILIEKADDANRPIRHHFLCDARSCDACADQQHPPLLLFGIPVTAQLTLMQVPAKHANRQAAGKREQELNRDDAGGNPNNSQMGRRGVPQREKDYRHGELRLAEPENVTHAEVAPRYSFHTEREERQQARGDDGKQQYPALRRLIRRQGSGVSNLIGDHKRHAYDDSVQNDLVRFRKQFFGHLRVSL